MCGIAGAMYADANHPVDGGLLRQMADSLAHRGPDGVGYWIGPGVGLAHRRLSIIDLAGGEQPMTNEDGTLQIVFNGEIYNYRELRTQLIHRGHSFRTNSDTEVILHLYEERGADAVSALRGMFAFALWDGHARQLLLARDRVGLKPLYFLRDDHHVVFGSELKAILTDPRVARDIDPWALDDYLTFGMVQGERSIIRNVMRVPPATSIIFRQRDLHTTTRRYWSLRFESTSWSQADAAEAVQAKLEETVRVHLIADVPVGAFLSGGVDSSIIVGLAAQALSTPIQTFSIGFDDPVLNELPYARVVARQFNTNHYEEIATADTVQLLDELVRYYDEPFADSSAIPTYLVSRLAARFVKVVLSGDGGDEAFGGYARYVRDFREHQVRRLLPSFVRGSIVAPLARIWPNGDVIPRVLRAKTVLTNLALSPSSAYANSMAIYRAGRQHPLLAECLREEVKGYAPEAFVAAAYERVGDADPIAAMIAADVDIRLPDNYLLKVDRASMANGLEVRPPFVDHELLELAAKIPSSLKVHRGQSKHLLKHTYQHLLAASAIRRPKQGFEIPLNAWLKGPLRGVVHDLVLGDRTKLEGLVDLEAVQSLASQHYSGASSNGRAIWSLLILAKWVGEYMNPIAATSNIGGPLRTAVVGSTQ